MSDGDENIGTKKSTDRITPCKFVAICRKNWKSVRRAYGTTRHCLRCATGLFTCGEACARARRICSPPVHTLPKCLPNGGGRRQPAVKTRI